MKKNVFMIERILRFTLGVFLCSWAIAGGPPWTVLGLFFLASASWAYCPVKRIIRRDF